MHHVYVTFYSPINVMTLFKSSGPITLKFNLTAELSHVHQYPSLMESLSYLSTLSS